MRTPDSATYDVREHNRLPGVDVSGSYSSRPQPHLMPAPIAPPGDLAEDAAGEAEQATVTAVGEPTRKPAPSRAPAEPPVEDGKVSRAYLPPKV